VFDIAKLAAQAMVPVHTPDMLDLGASRALVMLEASGALRSAAETAITAADRQSWFSANCTPHGCESIDIPQSAEVSVEPQHRSTSDQSERLAAPSTAAAMLPAAVAIPPMVSGDAACSVASGGPDFERTLSRGENSSASAGPSAAAPSALRATHESRLVSQVASVAKRILHNLALSNSQPQPVTIQPPQTDREPTRPSQPQPQPSGPAQPLQLPLPLQMRTEAAPSDCTDGLWTFLDAADLAVLILTQNRRDEGTSMSPASVLPLLQLLMSAIHTASTGFTGAKCGQVYRLLRLQVAAFATDWLFIHADELPQVVDREKMHLLIVAGRLVAEAALRAIGAASIALGAGSDNDSLAEFISGLKTINMTLNALVLTICGGVPGEIHSFCANGRGSRDSASQDPAIQDLAATQQLAEQALVAVVQLTIELGDRVAPGNVAVAREIDIMCRDLTICVEAALQHALGELNAAWKLCMEDGAVKQSRDVPQPIQLHLRMVVTLTALAAQLPPSRMPNATTLYRLVLDRLLSNQAHRFRLLVDTLDTVAEAVHCASRFLWANELGAVLPPPGSPSIELHKWQQMEETLQQHPRLGMHWYRTHVQEHMSSTLAALLRPQQAAGARASSDASAKPSVRMKTASAFAGRRSGNGVVADHLGNGSVDNESDDGPISKTSACGVGLALAKGRSDNTKSCGTRYGVINGTGDNTEADCTRHSMTDTAESNEEGASCKSQCRRSMNGRDGECEATTAAAARAQAFMDAVLKEEVRLMPHVAPDISRLGMFDAVRQPSLHWTSIVWASRSRYTDLKLLLILNLGPQRLVITIWS